MRESGRRTGYFAALIALHCALWLALLFFFHREGYALLWSPDGLFQHYTAFYHTSQYWTQAIKNLLHGQLPPSFLNYTIGQGSDMLLTLNTYDFTEPVTVLCAVMFRKNLLMGYACMIIIKNILSGVFFSAFCLVRGKRCGAAMLCASLSYAFCGYAVILSLQHPNFSDGIYLLPFLLMGLELCIQKKDGKVLIAGVMLSVLSNYYLLYINTMIGIVYAVIRICVIERESFKERFLMGGFLIGRFLMGLSLSSMVLFPSIHAFLNNTRLGQRTGYNKSVFFYQAEFYKDYLKELFWVTDCGHYTYMGVTPLGIICLILLLKRKKKPHLTRITIMVFGLLGIPLTGIVMNGFGYARNLWGYVFPFLIACCLVEGYGELAAITWREALGCMLFFGIYVWQGVRAGDRGIKTAILLAVILLLFFCGKPLLRERILPVMCIGITLFHISGSVYVCYSPDADNRMKRFLKEEEAVRIASQGFYHFMDLLPDQRDDDFYRIEKRQLGQNQEGQEGYCGTTYWWSIISQKETDFYKALEMNTLKQNCNFKGLDGRSALCALGAVRFYIAGTGEEAWKPFGFEETRRKDSYILYENKSALPVMYVYQSQIDQAYFESASPLEKQMLLLKGGVVPDFKSDEIVKEKPEVNVTEVPYTVLSDTGTNVTEQGFQIKKKGDSITISFQKQKDSEAYLWLEGTNLLSEKGELPFRVKVSGRGGEKESAFYNAGNNWAVLRTGMTVNLGSDFDGECLVTLTFSKKGELTYKKLHVQEVSLKEYQQDVAELKEIPVTNQKLEEGGVSGQVVSEKAGILQIALPYSKGWNAYVDGKREKIYQSGGMYMGVVLMPGEHNLKLVYQTPGLRCGWMFAAVTAILAFLFWTVRRNCRKSSSL